MQNCIQMSIFQYYGHVFWIPLFPFGKTGVTQCSHCQQILQKNDFDPNLTEVYNAVKTNAKAPLWTFVGLGILAGLLIWCVIDSRQDKAHNTQLLLAPKKGDVYEIKMDDKKYTLFKVDEVVNDTIFLLMHEYQTNLAAGLSDLKNQGTKGYGHDVLPLGKTDLMEMFNKGEIINVDRN